MIRHCSLVKRRRTANPTKNRGTLHFDWKTGGLGEVNGPRFVADSELAAKIRGALKIVRAPGRLALSKNTGNGDGAGEQMKIGAGRPGRLKMTLSDGGAEPKFRQGAS